MYLQCLAHIKGPVKSSYVVGLSSWTHFPFLSGSHLSFNTAETPSLQEDWVTCLLSTIVILYVIPFICNAFLFFYNCFFTYPAFFPFTPPTPVPGVNCGSYLLHKFIE